MSKLNIKTIEGRTDPPTMERLRADIDTGRTGEKVRYSDPAAVPLGADDEAAGHPPDSGQRRQEAASRRIASAPPREHWGGLMLYALLIVGIGLIALAAFLLLR